jgi:RNA polymerase sigma factor (sigma-70 family)
MAKGWLEDLVVYLRGLARPAEMGALTDAELLRRFTSAGNAAAFEVLVWRYGLLVAGLCRRLLRHTQDAEDVFQAAFLTLARKAGSITAGGSVGSWLYKVAYHIALRVRRRTAQLPMAAVPAGKLALPPSESAVVWRELGPVLDEEIQRLPERFRAPFVLCYLEGKTNEEAARELACPRGTVLSRLARARQRLRARLTRRGITLPTGTLAATLAEEAAAVFVPARWVHSVLRAVPSNAAGGSASAPVAALVQGALRTMRMNRLKTWMAVSLAACLLAGVAALVVSPARSAVPLNPDRKPPARTDGSKDTPGKADVWQIERVTLRSKTAQADAKLTARQIKKVHSLLQEVEQKFHGEMNQAVQDLANGQRAKAEAAFLRIDREMCKAVNKALPGFLKPVQIRRLREIDVQWRVPRVWQEPYIEKVLGLSAAQKKKIAGLVDKALKEMVALGAAFGSEDDDDKIRAIYGAATKKFEAVLTGPQKKRWQKLTGKRLKIEFDNQPVYEGP